MKRIASQIKSFVANENGATAIEYCLIAGLISIAIVTGATQIGQSVLGLLQSASDGFK
jgi:pilus assembly protein Flp/PilA